MLADAYADYKANGSGWKADSPQVQGMAGKAYFVLDSSKFGRLTPLRIPGFHQAAGVIVDTPPPPTISEALGRKGPRLVVAAE